MDSYHHHRRWRRRHHHPYNRDTMPPGPSSIRNPSPSSLNREITFLSSPSLETNSTTSPFRLSDSEFDVDSGFIHVPISSPDEEKDYMLDETRGDCASSDGCPVSYKAYLSEHDSCDQELDLGLSLSCKIDSEFEVSEDSDCYVLGEQTGFDVQSSDVNLELGLGLGGISSRPAAGSSSSSVEPKPSSEFGSFLAEEFPVVEPSEDTVIDLDQIADEDFQLDFASFDGPIISDDHHWATPPEDGEGWNVVDPLPVQLEEQSTNEVEDGDDANTTEPFEEFGGDLSGAFELYEEAMVGLWGSGDPLLLDEFISEFEEDAEYDEAVEASLNEWRGNQPASESAIRKLPFVVLTTEELEQDEISCPICKADILEDEDVRLLPCQHYYHGDCIIPWLGVSNTCPVCRFQLPTN